MAKGILVSVRGSRQLSSSLPGSTLTIEVPEVLRGKWTSSASISEATFDDPNTRATLHFSSTLLDADWGGDIVAASSEPKYVIFATGTKNCIGASLE
jgi:hypothetical protein